MKILVTGGTGYIGSHVAMELLAAGGEPVLLDNFSNSSPAALTALAELAGRKQIFVKGDIRDPRCLDDLFGRNDFLGVVHLAGLKSVNESLRAPLGYYENNVAGTACLLQAMARHGVKSIVYSSSAAVYASSDTGIDEDGPTAPASPYARSKLGAEEILRDLFASDPRWRVSILRYFNAGGAHPGGLIGENPAQFSNNLLPQIVKVATGRLDRLEVFGGDHPTPDGTCVRDYVHVVDIARLHVLAMKRLRAEAGLSTYNIGSGCGFSVLEVIRAFERVSGVAIPYRFADRRPGDAAAVVADPSRARNELGWESEYDLDRICADFWRWCQSEAAWRKCVA